MNKLIITLTLMAFVGCCERPPAIQQSSQAIQQAYDLGGKVIHIRDCDYVTLYTGSHVLVHAGDCPNPLHTTGSDTTK